MPVKKVEYRLGELFCGPGGIAVGARDAKYESNGIEYSIKHAWATDYDSDTCATYRHNICPENPETVICNDIRKQDLNELKAISEIDGFAFGFPCNDFSIVGEQKGTDGHYGPLYSYGVEILKLCKPKWFLAENVGGLSNSNEGKAFETILKELFETGYSLYPHLYSFEQYGVPQARKRIIIVGIHKDEDVSFAVPSTAPYAGVDVSVKTALTNPPIPRTAPNQEYTKQSVGVVERLKMLPAGENAWFIDVLLGKTDDQLVEFYRTFDAIKAKVLDVDFDSGVSIRKKLEAVRLSVKSARMSQIYRRMHPAKPSYTITGSGGGGTHGYHWQDDRALTNRERARIQTFPDSHEFIGSKESVRKQIGMAVPCKGIMVIFEAILKSFAGESYDSAPFSFHEPLLQPEHLGVYNTSHWEEMRLLEGNDS